MRIDRGAFVRLCRARDLLSEANARASSIREVAREVGISPFHFIRRFAALFGETPHQLRTRARLERAKLLLARGELSVTEVCFEVGFSSVGSFSQLFARRVGVPPSAYRRRWGQVPGEVPPALTPGCVELMGLLPAQAPQFPRSERGAEPLDVGHADQAHQRDGRRPGQGTPVLH